MPQIGLRASEELVEAIDNDKGPDESRSEYIRRAVRAQLTSDDLEDRLTGIENRLDDLDARIDDHETRIDDHENRIDDLESDGWLF